MVYQIKNPGDLTESLSEWVDQLEIDVKTDAEKTPVTMLTGEMDQVYLIGLSRRLYSLGLALISVIRVDDQ